MGVAINEQTRYPFRRTKKNDPTQGDRKGTPLLYHGAYVAFFTYIVGAGLAPALSSFAVDLEEVVSLVVSLLLT